jgi:hypothetical protein
MALFYEKKTKLLPYVEYPAGQGFTLPLLKLNGKTTSLWIFDSEFVVLARSQIYRNFLAQLLSLYFVFNIMLVIFFWSTYFTKFLIYFHEHFD